MEGKPHASHTYTTAGQPSRMAKDLQRCTEDFQATFRPRKSTRSRASQSCTARQRDVRVCVIGAGLAGLRCAQALVNQGANVTVFEARDRVGGRIYQEDLQGSGVDMGPNWVHGTESNPIVRLANETTTILKSLGEDSSVYGLHGKSLNAKQIADNYDLIWDVISDAFKLSNQECSTIRPEKSLKDFFREALWRRNICEEHQTQILQMAEMWGSFIGDDWELQSLKWFWLEECLDGENLFVVNTHQQIIERIAKVVRRSADIHLSAKVTHVVSVDASPHDPKVFVTVSYAGHPYEFEFDEVVITVPLGCLKHNAITFQPSLSADISTAIRHASISSYEKVYLVFPTAFWDGLTADDSKALPFPAFASFVSSSLEGEGIESLSLELNTLSNSDVFGEHARPALLFNLFGRSSRAFSSLIQDLTPGTEMYRQTIDIFFRPYYSLLPNYQAHDTNCCPSAALATNWQCDELAGYGSYTNFKVSSGMAEEVELDKEVETMRQGHPERGIWLAGEHTAPFVALGTSTGAYWSGESVAMRILAANGFLSDEGYHSDNGK